MQASVLQTCPTAKLVEMIWETIHVILFGLELLQVVTQTSMRLLCYWLIG